MVARIWKGKVAAADGDEYVQYIEDTGIAEYVATPGNRGTWMLRRDEDGLTEIITFTLWDSIEAVKEFAGEDYEKAHYYPEDDRFLVEKEETVLHYEVVSEAPPPA